MQGCQALADSLSYLPQVHFSSFDCSQAPRPVAPERLSACVSRRPSTAREALAALLVRLGGSIYVLSPSARSDASG